MIDAPGGLDPSPSAVLHPPEANGPWPGPDWNVGAGLFCCAPLERLIS